MTTIINPMANDPCPESPYQDIYANDEHYHHSDKGCEIEMRRDNRFTIGSNQNINYAYCKTHNVYCSKTGWEFHWYGGTHSLSMYSPRFRRRCRVCGQWIETNKAENRFICQSCENINNMS